MRRPIVHIVGAGFSGLSTAIRLSANPLADIVVHERGAQPGGRRRSFPDEAWGPSIDTVNPIAWSHWRSTMALLDEIGARGQWRDIGADLAFVDMANGEHWTLRPNSGRFAWWPLFARRRAPGTTAADYFRARKLRDAPDLARLIDYAPPPGTAMERLWRPFALAALGVEPAEASAALAAGALGEALAPRGARMWLPVGEFARAFVEPALKYLRKREVAVRCERELQKLIFVGDRVAALDFQHDRVDLGPRDAVVLALSPWVTAPLVPGLLAPDEFSATIVAHFAAQPPPDAPPVTVVVNGPIHFLFCHADRISIGVRDAGALLETPREELAATFWAAAAPITHLADDLPAWRVIRQKRAAFAATPGQDALRPEPVTPWSNLILAGGYVRNGLPETMEGAVRSGEVAARLVEGLL